MGELTSQVQLPPGLELPASFSSLHLEMLSRAKQVAAESLDDYVDLSSLKCAAGPIEGSMSANSDKLGHELQQASRIQNHDDVSSLQTTVEDDNLGALGVQSVGSTWHHLGLCKPCDFVTRGGCRLGTSCSYCHLCGKGENRRRKKERQQLVSVARNFQSGIIAQQRRLAVRRNGANGAFQSGAMAQQCRLANTTGC